MSGGSWFDGIVFEAYNRDDACRAWVDAAFPYYAINMASRGYLTWECGGRGSPRLRLQAPVFFWTLPGVRYRYGCSDGNGWEHQWVAFSGHRADRYVAAGLLSRDSVRPFVHVKDPFRMRSAFLELQEYLATPSLGAPRAVVLLESLLLQAHEQALMPIPGRPHGARLQDLAGRICRDVARRWDFRGEAAQMCLSYSRFRKVFRETVGLAPQAYLIRKRLESAASLLRHSHLPVKRIAAQVGIDDIYYLTKVFRKAYGLPPAAYRARHRLPPPPEPA